MKKVRILLDFLRMGNGALEQKAKIVAAAMKNNAYFPNPVPGLDVLNAAIQLYSDALLAAQNRDRLRIAERNTLRGKLEALLVQLSNYVTAVANGDKTIMLSSGFTVSGEANASAGMATVRNFTVEQGANSGELYMSVKRVPGARTYSFYYAIAGTDNPVWQLEETTTTYATLRNLQPGQTYICYVKAVGAKGKTVKSDIVTKTVY